MSANPIYFSCNASSPLLGKLTYQWQDVSPEASGAAPDITGYLLRRFFKTSYSSNPPDTMLMQLFNELPDAIQQAELPAHSLWRKPLLKIALENFDRNFDSGFTCCHVPPSFFFYLRRTIEDLLKHYTVAINFTELFFVYPGTCPPAHYRPGIDHCVDSREDHREARGRISYQLGKMLFNTFGSQDNLPTISANPIVACYATKNLFNRHYYYCDVRTPINQLVFFHSRFEYAELSTAFSPVLTRSILTFDGAVSIGSLIYEITRGSAAELIIVLKGAYFQDAKEREKIYLDILEMIETNRCTKIIHVILLSKEGITRNLLELAPVNLSLTDAFSPLAEEAGYYLSAPEFFEAIYRNRQKFSGEIVPVHHLRTSLVFKTPITTSQPTFIYRQHQSAGFRKSKRLNQQELKAQSDLCLEHQQTLVQTQVVNHTQVITQTQTVALQQQQSIDEDQAAHQDRSANHSPPFYSSEEFCEVLQRKAISILEERTEEDRWIDSIYLSKHYQQGHSKWFYYHKLAHDLRFRQEITAKIFGFVLTGDKSRCQLPHYFVESVTHKLFNTVFYSIESCLDGAPVADRHIFHRSRIFGGNLLTNIERTSTGSHPSLNPFYYDIKNSLKLSSLSFLSAEKTFYHSHLTSIVLLSKTDLQDLDEGRKLELITDTELLLQLFKPDVEVSEELIEQQKIRLFKLIKFYFPTQPDYLSVLQQLFAQFDEPSAENLRILLQVLIDGHRYRMGCLLDLLLELDARGLLTYFYKIYFKYACTVCSLSRSLLLFSTETVEKTRTNAFIKSMFAIPPTTSREDWPLFEKWFLNTMVFFAKHNPNACQAWLQNTNFHAEISDYWFTLSSKFLSYTQQNDQEAKELLACLTENLLKDDELSIAPITQPYTFYMVLYTIIDRAIAQHNLREQLLELRNLSFVYTDVPYAISHNDFHIVCAEMDLYAAALNPSTKSYAVSLDELKKAVKKHTLGDAYLKRAIFRYLGKVSLRESLEFYRELFKRFQPENIHLKEVLIGHYVAHHTGLNFNYPLQKEKFLNDFLHVHPVYSTSMPPGILDDFFQIIDVLPTQTQQGNQSLWDIWSRHSLPILSDGIDVVPDVLLRRFNREQMQDFLLKNAAALQQSALMLAPGSDLPLTLLKTLFNDDEKAAQEKNIALLRLVYPRLNMHELSKDLGKIIAFIRYYTALIEQGGQLNTFNALERLLQDGMSFDWVLDALQFFTEEIHVQSDEKDPLMANFLLDFAAHTQGHSFQEHRPLYSLIINYYLRSKLTEISLPFLLHLSDVLIPLGIEEASDALRKVLHSMNTLEAYHFFRDHAAIPAAQWPLVTQFIEDINDNSLSLPFLREFLQESDDLYALAEELKTLSAEHKKNCISLCHLFYKKTPHNSLTWLKQFKDLDEDLLLNLIHLHELYFLSEEELLALITSPSIPAAIEAFKQSKYALNLERYHYDKDHVAQKIAQIKVKSLTEDDDTYLSPTAQAQLLDDYQCLMSFMLEKPFFTVYDASFTPQKYSIHQLSDRDFPIFAKQAYAAIAENDVNQHQHQLLLLALACEMMYRKTKKFPRDTQILVLLSSLYEQGHLINEVQTGEGKSIIAALEAVLLWDGEHPIDIATENSFLAQEGLRKFKLFYQSLGIPCAQDIIEAHSQPAAYLSNGIHYSTASHLALFRARMLMENHPLPTKVALICDEIDATLTTTLQYRLSTTIDSLYLNTQMWSIIYQCILDFIGDQDLFIDNFCDSDDDVENFIRYFISKNLKEEFIAFIKQLKKSEINTLIESALVANGLEENIDYIRVVKAKCFYAAPLLKSTKRPDPRVNYSAAVQQLLHTKLNRQLKSSKMQFAIEPLSDTLIVVSAKNFFDDYRRGGGRIIGLTGTAGSSIELQEFAQYHHLHALSYPSFHHNNCTDLGTFYASGHVAHQQLILDYITEHKKTQPSQPILIITGSPQETLDLSDYLFGKVNWPLQYYSGYEQDGDSEAMIIHKAGQDNMVTIANESLARGADIKPAHAQGLLGISTCTELSNSDLRQIKGRVSRDGKPGLFALILDIKKLALPEDSSIEVVNEAFSRHRRSLSLLRQQQRLKMHRLEEVRHHIVKYYLLKLKNEADDILVRQYGAQNKLISHQKLMDGLNQFNHRTEQHYKQLLEQHGQVEEQVADTFIEASVQQYYQILNTWIKDGQFEATNPIEPIVALEHLDNLSHLHELSIHQLSLFSDCWFLLWKELGHQNSQILFEFFDASLLEFQPYSDGRCSFRHVFIEWLIAHRFLDHPQLVKAVGEMHDNCAQIPILGSSLASYCLRLKDQVQEKKWDEMKLPLVGQALKLFTGAIVKRSIIPMMIEQLTFVFKELFGDIDLSFLSSLTEVSSDLTRAIKAILKESSNLLDMKVSSIIKNIVPLFKNKAILAIAKRYLELNQQGHLIPDIDKFPAFLQKIEAYRTHRLGDFANIKTLMKVLHQFCRFEFLGLLVKGTPFEVLTQKMHELSTESIESFAALGSKKLLDLTNTISHPNFNHFLKKLPQEASCSTLCTWVKDKARSAPPAVKAAWDELDTYQKNSKRIVAAQQKSLATLKERFYLNSWQLQDELNELHRRPLSPELKGVAQENARMLEVEQVSLGLPPKPSSWLKPFAIVFLLSTLIVLNCFLFSLPVLFISLSLLTLGMSALLYQTMRKPPSPKSSTSTMFESYEQAPNGVEPLTRVSSPQRQTTQAARQVAPGRHGLFKGPRDDETMATPAPAPALHQLRNPAGIRN
jgi:hypothetical protein